jgi:arylsulfatase A-like enzyme
MMPAASAALLTGRNSHSVGMGTVPEASAWFPGYNASIPRSAATLLEILRQNGYGTAWVAKTHLTPLHEVTPAGPFDRWPGGMARSTSTASSAPG